MLNYGALSAPRDLEFHKNTELKMGQIISAGHKISELCILSSYTDLTGHHVNIYYSPLFRTRSSAVVLRGDPSPERAAVRAEGGGAAAGVREQRGQLARPVPAARRPRRRVRLLLLAAGSHPPRAQGTRPVDPKDFGNTLKFDNILSRQSVFGIWDIQIQLDRPPLPPTVPRAREPAGNCAVEKVPHVCVVRRAPLRHGVPHRKDFRRRPHLVAQLRDPPGPPPSLTGA